MLPDDGKEVLYVDDEPTALKYFEQLFGKEFRVRCASSGEDAWNYIQENAHRVAVLVTDQRMGAVSGTQLMERVRSFHPQIVRVLITAYTQLDYAVKAVNQGGAFRYLTKPFDDQELTGTLLRACEFHSMVVQRDRLIDEKLSVLHRMIVMDRVRGLAIAMTALQDRLRNAWPALVDYMQQSPVKHRIGIQVKEIADMDLLAIAATETESMVATVTHLIEETVRHAADDWNRLDAAEIARHFCESQKSELLQDDLDLEFSSDSPCWLESDSGLLHQLYSILLRRLSDVQDQPSRIDWKLTDRPDSVIIDVRGSFRALDSDQYASFFAAAIPLHQWPIGLDMDLLAAFLIAHHLGGKLVVEREPPSGPGIKVTLPKQVSDPSSEPANLEVKPEWLDTAYDLLKAWQEDILIRT